MSELTKTVMAALLAAALLPTLAHGYSLDGGERTGIRRLEGYQNAQSSDDRSARKLPPGALLATSAIRLNLAGEGDGWDVTSNDKDPELQAALESLFATRDPSYAVALIDITDPEHIVWAGLREDTSFYPGSVGKVLCMIALFAELAHAFPDPDDRLRVLRETTIEATDWVVSDSHKVPHFEAETGRNRFATISTGDSFTLAEWLDHMVSPSSNAAGATVWKEALLLRQFGAAYPPSRKTEDAYFASASKTELTALSQAVINDALGGASIDTDRVRQGSMWTRTGKRRIPGIKSFGTPKEFARILLRLEQGRMVDRWSSLEMKRYLYMTKKRYRYAYPTELADAAVYFKSGSLYSCKDEPGFRCGKYRGNVKNIMNSIAIVESPAQRDSAQKRYIVVLMSNVLRKNSAWDHARLAAAVEEAVQTRGQTEVNERGTDDERAAAGRSH